MKGLFVILGLLFCLSSFPQERRVIKGVILNENGSPLESANISLSVSQKVIGQTFSLSDGSFIIKSVSDNNVISVSHLGYQSQSFQFTILKDTIDLDSIVMLPATTILEEVTVKAKAVLITKTGRVYLPSSQKKEMVSDGLSLLAMLNLPKMSIIPGSKTVEYWGKGSIVYYINDVMANIAQIQALPSKIITKVEYINRPGIEYGLDVGLVIKISTQKLDRGLYNSISVKKPLNRSAGSVDLESRFNYKKSELAINLNTSYTNSKKHVDEDRNKEHFIIGDEKIFGEEKQVGGFLKEYSHNLSINYLYKIGKGRFSVKWIYDKEKTPHDDQEFIRNQSQLGDIYKTLSRQKDKNVSIAAIDYRLPINRKDLFTTNVFYYYLKHTGSRGYEEKGEDFISQFNSYVKGFSQGVRFRSGFVKNISPKWSIQSSITDYYTYFSNTYTEPFHNVSKIERNVLSCSTGIIYKVDNFESMILLNLGYNYTKLDKEKNHHVFEPQISMDLSYLFNSIGSVNCNFGFKSLRPLPEDLSPASQVIDSYQIRRGNPSLKTGYAVNMDVEFSMDFGFFELNAYSNNEIAYKSIQEQTFLNDNKVIRMADNCKYVVALKNGIELSTQFPSFMRASLGIGYNWFKSKTDVGKIYYYGKPWFRTSVDFYIKKWMFNCSFWTHNNDFYGEVLETSGRALSFVLMKSWLDGKLSTSLRYDNPLKSYAKQGVVNKSMIAPYENWTFSRYTTNMISLNLSYKFTIGRKHRTPQTIDVPEINDGQISSKKSAEIK